MARPTSRGAGLSFRSATGIWPAAYPAPSQPALGIRRSGLDPARAPAPKKRSRHRDRANAVPSMVVSGWASSLLAWQISYERSDAVTLRKFCRSLLVLARELG